MDEQEKGLEEILRMFDKAPSPSSKRNNQTQMRQKNLQSRQVPQKPTNAERTVRTSNQIAYKRQTQSSKGRYLSPKRKAAIKRRNRRRIVIVSVLALLFVVIFIVLICKGCAGGKKDLSVLQGTWYYDQYTEYEFDGKGNGCMCIEKTNHYEFTYDIDGDTLKMDYALDYVTDCEYTYTVDGDKLTLVGGNGTVEPGKVYELTLVTE